MEAPLTVQIVEFNTKVMQEELKKLGLKVNHHEANITFLKSEIYAIEESIADLTSKILCVCHPGFMHSRLRCSYLRMQHVDTIWQTTKHVNYVVVC
ncbi:unnamed protein product [Triticum turgidum subsp. durum]|uniref:Uncharacterized protein n=1 Tax=Triticum turgidum subsp. durum TaxID=4567 RepID=A0A9R0VHP1_TRITD|nr:unnamed protein product [Triticum turgidum subsp. durum]